MTAAYKGTGITLYKKSETFCNQDGSDFMLLVLLFISARQVEDSKNIAVYPEVQIKSRKAKPVYALGIVLVGGSGILCQNADQRAAFLLREL